MFDSCIYFQVSTLYRKLNGIWEQEFMRCGLSPSHGYTLKAILQNPGIGQKELGQVLSLKPSTITRFIDVLERKKLVERQTSGKESQVYPTVCAHKLEPQLTDITESLVSFLKERVSSKQIEELVNELHQFNNKLK